MHHVTVSYASLFHVYKLYIQASITYTSKLNAILYAALYSIYSILYTLYSISLLLTTYYVLRTTCNLLLTALWTHALHDKSQVTSGMWHRIPYQSYLLSMIKLNVLTAHHSPLTSRMLKDNRRQTANNNAQCTTASKHKLAHRSWLLLFKYTFMRSCVHTSHLTSHARASCMLTR